MNFLNKQKKKSSLTEKVNGAGTREERGLDSHTEGERRRNCWTLTQNKDVILTQVSQFPTKLHNCLCQQSEDVNRSEMSGGGRVTVSSSPRAGLPLSTS